MIDSPRSDLTLKCCTKQTPTIPIRIQWLCFARRVHLELTHIRCESRSFVILGRAIIQIYTIEYLYMHTGKHSAIDYPRTKVSYKITISAPTHPNQSVAPPFKWIVGVVLSANIENEWTTTKLCLLFNFFAEHRRPAHHCASRNFVVVANLVHICICFPHKVSQLTNWRCSGRWLGGGRGEGLELIWNM